MDDELIEIQDQPTNGNGSTGFGQIAAMDLFKNFGGRGDPTKVFTTPGTNDELLMRTVFKDEREEIANIRLYSKANRFKVQVAQDDLRRHWAGKSAINGRSTLLCLQGQTGVVVSDFVAKGSKGRAQQQPQQMKVRHTDDDDRHIKGN